MTERLQIIDPGLVRLRAAVQALLVLLLGGGAAALLFAWLGWPTRIGMLGGMIGMMATSLLKATSTRAKLAQIAGMAGVALASATLAALLSPWPHWSYAGFLVVMAAAPWAQRLAWLGAGGGLVAFLAHFNTLFVHVGPGQLHELAVSVLCGFAALLLVALVLMPDAPAQRVVRVLPGFGARVRHLLATAEQVLARGETELGIRRLLAANADVQTTALDLDAALEDPRARAVVADPLRLRDHVFLVELLVDHLVALAVRALRHPDDETRRAMVECMRRWSTSAERPGAPWTPSTAELLAPLPGETLPRLAEIERRMTAALASVALAARPPGADRTTSEDPWPHEPRASRPGVHGMPDDARLAARKMVQVTLAGGASIALGIWLSETYWYFAVIGAFVTLLTTPTRGASVRRAVERVVGTALGVLLGVALAGLLANWTSLELVVIALLTVVALWSLRVSYTVMMLLFTAIIALVYELSGIFEPGLLLVRLWETAAGASLGALTSLLVLPLSTRASIDEHLARTLAALDELLAALDPRTTGEERHETVYGRMRELDRAVAEFRDAGKPLDTRLPLRSARDNQRDVLLVSSLRFRARLLATATTNRDGTLDALEPSSVPALDLLRRRIAWMRTQLTAPESPAQGELPADASAWTRATGHSGTALRAIDERLETFVESRRLDRLCPRPIA